MDDELEQIVQRMIEAGEPEEAIASVIREYSPAPSTPTSPVVAAGAGVMRAAPAIVSVVNKVAPVAGKMIAAKGATPAVMAGIAGERVMRGDYGGAATAVGTGVAAGAAPKIAKAIQSATNPGVVAARDAAGRFMFGGKPAGWLARVAGLGSKAAGALGWPLALLSGSYDLQRHTYDMANDPNQPEARRKLLEEFMARMNDPFTLK